MRIVLNIKPTVHKSKFKQGITENFSRYADWCSSNIGYGLMTKENVIGINYEKHNRKCKVVKGKRQVVRESGWVAFVYTIPRSMVSNFKQNKRNFKLQIKV